MSVETIPYDLDSGLAADERAALPAATTSDRSRAGVLVLHAWGGQDDFARAQAAWLAAHGYVGFAADLYGTGRRAAPGDRDAAHALMTPPPESVLALARELTDAGADWQLHAHGRTMHAFTNPAANDRSLGTVYDADADRRARAACLALLDEALGS